MPNRAARSYLFVPGNRPDRFDKAFASQADAVIVDLEDAVPPKEKATARAAVAAWLTRSRPVFIRINGADTPWFRDDVALCQCPGVAGVVIPKAELVEDIGYVAANTDSSAAMLPLIETAKGLWNAHSIALASRVECLLFGSIDFQLDLRMNGEDAELLPFRTQLVLLSRVAGIRPPIDGVTVDITDSAVLRSAVRQARRLGFGGKLCIHPSQIGVVNEAFSPTEIEVAWAKRIVAAAAQAGGGAIAVDGKMVDRPVILRAEAILGAIESDV
jgi:citrate lyase subunit beta / citryl-CoA lyase